MPGERQLFEAITRSSFDATGLGRDLAESRLAFAQSRYDEGERSVSTEPGTPPVPEGACSADISQLARFRIGPVRMMGAALGTGGVERLRAVADLSGRG